MKFAKGKWFSRSSAFYSTPKGSQSCTGAGRRPKVETQDDNGDATCSRSDVSGAKVSTLANSSALQFPANPLYPGTQTSLVMK